MSIGGRIKNMMKSWLDIQEAQSRQINIIESYDVETNCIKNEIWYRGDPQEISMFYKTMECERDTFWAASPRVNIRKIHSGLPAIVIDTLAGLIVRDMNGIDAGTKKIEWETLENDNNFEEVVETAIANTLAVGDGAFKCSFDKSISNNVIIEFISGSNVEFVYKRGRYTETIFKAIHQIDRRRYIHTETYGFGYIKNKLIDASTNKEVPLDTIKALSKVKDFWFSGYEEDANGNVLQKGTVNLAIPLKFYKSAKYKNRGRALFDGKTHNLDALDEVISQWADAVRAGRAVKYIPESLLPRNPETGKVLPMNPFDDRFIAIENGLSEDAKNKIEVTQPDIPVSSYESSYINYLDLCLQGIISPSTLGIDTKKLDNAEAQREKEKTTLYTRGKIIDALQKVLPKVVNTALMANSIYNGIGITEEIDVDVPFGEYANPSFEAVVETVSKAKTGGIMSIEASIEELYGDSKDEDWKTKEVKRLKEEQGITELREPGMNTPDILVDEGEVLDDSFN